MHLSNIFTYPIKSTHPISLESGFLFTEGVGLDRHWMVVDENNAMVTSRKQPKLLHIATKVAGDQLKVMLPEQTFFIPIVPKPSNAIMVAHWGEDLLTSWPQNAALDDALSHYLGSKCSLVYSASLQSNDGAKSLSFADAQPVLLTTTSSLLALNERLREPVGMDRFRANLVVNNEIADVEDDWQLIRVGECELQVTCPCERCVLTTIDPKLLRPHPQQEPLRTLATYRRLPKGGVGFGINLTVTKPGPINVGDPVEVLR